VIDIKIDKQGLLVWLLHTAFKTFVLLISLLRSIYLGKIHPISLLLFLYFLIIVAVPT
jgi:hypothetical protein